MPCILQFYFTKEYKRKKYEPFAVINADDYYEKEAFVKLHNFLAGYTPEKANQFCMAGFILKNTLSENGAVTRGICETNEEGYLTAIHETSNIVKSRGCSSRRRWTAYFN
ncbi:hypothetical protein [Anaerobutyricum soehngenii]